jgi:hypothetical protein
MILNMKSQGMDSSNVMNFFHLLRGFGLFHLLRCSLTIEIDTSKKNSKDSLTIEIDTSEKVVRFTH